jgi:hypothetical protein
LAVGPRQVAAGQRFEDLKELLVAEEQGPLVFKGRSSLHERIGTTTNASGTAGRRRYPGWWFRPLSPLGPPLEPRERRFDVE